MARQYTTDKVYDFASYQNGSAARALDYGTAAPQIHRPQGLPKEVVLPQQQRRVKVKTAVAPFGVIGLAVVVCLMVLVVFGYVQLYEATERVSDIEYQIAELQEENRILESLYESSIDLDYIEQRAAELGFSVPSKDQTVYLNLFGSDRAEIYHTEETNLIRRVVQAIESSAGGLVEYLS